MQTTAVCCESEEESGEGSLSTSTRGWAHNSHDRARSLKMDLTGNGRRYYHVYTQRWRPSRPLDGYRTQFMRYIFVKATLFLFQSYKVTTSCCLLLCLVFRVGFFPYKTRMLRNTSSSVYRNRRMTRVRISPWNYRTDPTQQRS